MRLPLSEIRSRAMAFATEWKDATSERAEAQTFWTELFTVFGIKRRSVASFEEKVRSLGKGFDRIDVFYSGVMLGEHKSRGESMTKAASQAFDYVQSLTREGRHDEVPQFIVVSDFARLVIYDLDAADPALPVADFPTAQLYDNIRHFGFLSGYATKPVDPEDPINIRAVEILGALHDALEQGGYAGHNLERFLVRVLFCLFADDTGIFDPDTFKMLVQESRADGSDLGPALARLFKVLDTAPKHRASGLPNDLKALPHVNGALFAEDLGFAEFTGPMRAALLKSCDFNWSRISPAVFGSLFQSVMAGDTGKKRRRQIGAHYTSERDIMKLIRSLFLDDLQAELELCRGNLKRLKAFQGKLAGLRFLDPACGCGNFLVVTYRELRLLELEVLQELHGGKFDSKRLLMESLLKVDVDQMHGIELEEWPARIAEVAMWLIDHQMNLRVGEAFGEPVLRLPLEKSAKIVVGNALQTDWNSVLPANYCSFVLGNPPFVGKKEQSAQQKTDMNLVWHETKGAGILDYVTCWYLKAACYITGTRIRCAFVSTNSVSQGEQVGVLWSELYERYHIKIHFAHRTFTWMSEARGKAHVHVVIIGFGAFDYAAKLIYEYDHADGSPTCISVGNINPYLVEGGDTTVRTRTVPLNGAPAISYGSMMIDKARDSGDEAGLILSPATRAALLVESPELAQFIRRLYGGDEFLNGTERWCLWLVDAPPSILRDSPLLRSRVAAIRDFRENSKRPQTNALAATPTLFGEIRQPTTPYLLIPKVSSQTRRYLPVGFLAPDVIASGSALVVPDATVYHFGILSSTMHNAWMRTVAGRMKSDYQYSNNIVYNNFPWPPEVSARDRAVVEAAAQAVLDARVQFPASTLAALYDPLSMPAPLAKAHADLDRVVDRCYRREPFSSDRNRVEYLFALYERLTAPLVPVPVAVRKRKRAGPST